MKILEQLYYGNIEPMEQRSPTGSKYDRQRTQTADTGNQLMKSLDEEQKKLFLRFEQESHAHDSMSECQMFVKGFQLGARMMLEALDESGWNCNAEEKECSERA